MEAKHGDEADGCPFKAGVDGLVHGVTPKNRGNFGGMSKNTNEKSISSTTSHIRYSISEYNMRKCVYLNLEEGSERGVLTDYAPTEKTMLSDQPTTVNEKSYA